MFSRKTAQKGKHGHPEQKGIKKNIKLSIFWKHIKLKSIKGTQMKIHYCHGYFNGQLFCFCCFFFGSGGNLFEEQLSFKDLINILCEIKIKRRKKIHSAFFYIINF